jgi:hypothetical protein
MVSNLTNIKIKIKIKNIFLQITELKKTTTFDVRNAGGGK